METPRNLINVVETTQVSPLLSDELAGQKIFHLSFFDFLWLKFPPTERLFFYEFTGSSTDFNTTILHRLKHSLALALSYYRPLAGHLMWTSNEPKPYILCSSTDSVSVVVAESSAEFDTLSSKGNILKAIELRSYVPSLHITDEAARILSLQITFFPGFGFCIGVAAHHAIVDGKSTSMFMKSWAYLCQEFNHKNENPPKLPAHLAPFLDRTVIKDPTGKVDMLYLNWWSGIDKNPEVSPRSLKVFEMGGPIGEDHVRATFDLSKQDICKLREKIISKLDDKSNSNNDLHLSSFTITLAHAIVCYVKAKAVEGNAKVNFAFAADFRSRLVPPLPANYFGNCVSGDKIKLLEARNVVGENGLMILAKEISEFIKNLGKYGYFERVEEVFNSYKKLEIDRNIGAIGVAGSPKFELYGVDFGWGRPRKVDVVSIDKATSFSMAESGDQSGGIEVGFVMKSKDELQTFASLFVNGVE
ncbi:hypothetical protein ACFE04_007322 [Oxalis oulophora]